MRIGSLFSGYGGLDLAAMQLFPGSSVAWHCEWDDAPSKILDFHWPTVPNYRDVTKVDFYPDPRVVGSIEPIDILTGGYPCQPFSAAGKRKGADDERHLWPYVREAIRYLRPRFTLLENVAGHRSLGFDRVLGDLAEDGMYVQWTSLRASDIGAPHHRERLFILVTDPSSSRPESIDGFSWGGTSRGQGDGVSGGGDRRTDAPDSDGSTFWEHAGGASQEEAWPQGGDGSGDPRRERPDQDGWDASHPEGGTRGVGNGDDVRTRRTPGRLYEDSGRGSVADAEGERQARFERGGGSSAEVADVDGGLGSLSDAERIGCDGRRIRPGDKEGERSSREADRRSEGVEWGDYAPAIRRWERLTRPAPSPTELNSNNRPRLNAAFGEWMMGLPAGHVTDPAIGISRAHQLKAIGNGVCPPQAVAAYSSMFARLAAAA